MSATIEAQNAGWTFGDDVAETLVGHIRQSVPMYEEGHDLVCQHSDYFASYQIGVVRG